LGLAFVVETCVQGSEIEFAVDSTTRARSTDDFRRGFRGAEWPDGSCGGARETGARAHSDLDFSQIQPATVSESVVDVNRFHTSLPNS
jgi:hypothetical protein